MISEQGTTINPTVDKVEVLHRPPSPAQASQLATTGAPAAAAAGRDPKSRGVKQQQKPKGSTAPISRWRQVSVGFFQDAKELHYFVANKPKVGLLENKGDERNNRVTCKRSM